MLPRRVLLLLLIALTGLISAVAVASAASLSAGSPDSSYGSGGVVDEDFLGTQNADQANAVAVQSNGDIVTAGETQTDDEGPRAFVARYTAAGARDTSFGSAPGGFDLFIVCFDNSCGTQDAQAVAVESNGDIVVAGTALNNEAFFVARLLPNGTVDSSFAGAGGDGAGLDALQVGGSTGSYTVSGVAVQSNGAILVSGTSGSTGFVARVLAAGGGLDTSFNTSGVYTSGSDPFGGISLQSNGTILVAGNSTGKVFTERLLSTGAVDSTFTPSSQQIGTDHQTVAGLVGTASGSVVASTDGQAVTPRIGLFAYTSTGALDLTFGAGVGYEGLSLPDNDSPRVTGITADSTGRLIVVGQDGTTRHMFLLRTLANGTPDASFGSGGFALPSLNPSDSADAVTVDVSNNPIVAGSGTLTGRSDTDALSARFLATAPPEPPATTPPATTTPPVTTTPAPTTPPAPTTTPVTTTTTQPTSTAGVVTATLSRVTEKRAKFTARNGTSFSFTLSHPATVKFVFTKLLAGRRVGRSCAAQTRRNAHAKACTRSVAAGSFTRTETVGAHTVAFTAKVGAKKLAAGRYTVSISVVKTRTTVGAGARTLSFTLVG